jgi:hypothetical protein
VFQEKTDKEKEDGKDDKEEGEEEERRFDPSGYDRELVDMLGKI